MKENLKAAMMPIGALMIEHRLIERMVDLLEKELQKISKVNRIDGNLVNASVDFFKFYADHNHHGKEEDILFTELLKRGISTQDKAMIESLKLDHIKGRELVSKLEDDARQGRRQCTPEIIKSITADIGNLVRLYNAHIRKEDKQFFIPAMKYFSKQEQDSMLRRFWEFDRLLIHEKYRQTVEGLEKASQFS